MAARPASLLADGGVAGLALLEHGQERRGDEDRRVGPGEQADEQRQGEVLEGGRPRRYAPTTSSDRTGSTAMIEVLSDRISTSFIERLTTPEYVSRPLAPIPAVFSSTLSNTTTVS